MLVSLGNNFQRSHATISDVITLPGSFSAAVAKLLEFVSQAASSNHHSHRVSPAGDGERDRQSPGDIIGALGSSCA